MRKRSFVKADKPAGNGLLLGYARVSKGDDQTNTLQATALRAAAVAVSSRKLHQVAAGTGQSCTACSTTCAKETRWWSGTRPPLSLAEGRAPHHGAYRRGRRRFSVAD